MQQSIRAESQALNSLQDAFVKVGGVIALGFNANQRKATIRSGSWRDIIDFRKAFKKLSPRVAAMWDRTPNDFKEEARALYSALAFQENMFFGRSLTWHAKSLVRHPVGWTKQFSMLAGLHRDTDLVIALLAEWDKPSNEAWADITRRKPRLTKLIDRRGKQVGVDWETFRESTR